MKRKPEALAASRLRRDAEARLRLRQPALPLAHADSLALLHELQVHQIELQMQNEELQAAQAQIEAQLERYRELYDTTLIGHLRLLQDGSISRVNRAAAGMLGLAPSRLANRRLSEWTAPESREAFSAFLRKAFAENGRQSCQIALEPAAGDKIHVHLEAFSAVSGKAVRVSMLDISERKQVEAERQARLAAEAASRTKSEFLASMSHELRTPLNTILGFARLMANDPAMPATARDDLERIVKSAELLYELVSQVLDLSKLEAGGTTLNEVDFNLYLLLDDLQEFFAATAEAQGVHLLFAPRRNLPPQIRSDPLKLRQVLMNLIGNALKFTREGSVSVAVETLAPVSTAAGNAGDPPVRLAFTVADSGPGIAPDELENLFEAFVQAEAGRLAQQGTGLGLAISRGIVRLLGGEIQLDSEVGRGTSVRFEIPVGIAATVTTSGDAAFRRVLGLTPGQRRYRMLIVASQAEAREPLVRLVAPLGLEVQAAADGEQAIIQWQRWRPDLIWMDLAVPVLRGIETARRIRALPRGQRVVIIAVGDAGQRGEALAAGCNELLRKPIRDADVFAALENHLGVSFLYQDDASVAPPRLAAVAGAFVELPEALRASLEQALVRLDSEAVDQAIGLIHGRDARLAGALAPWARDFQYDHILSFIRSAGERPDGEQRPAPDG
jgi:PAS domain S-box-containing protein